MALADGCRLSTADLETLSGVLSVVLTASRNVVYIHFPEAEFSPCWGRGFWWGWLPPPHSYPSRPQSRPSRPQSRAPVDVCQ